ncbi:hypothetical protein [Anaerosporobacter faecicola]|uniref:hypothetical protein n=1 Tax=Anaerosporobacter faecicola TaxID=2718714 RepID=UPI0014394A57|nr:hypothetical protein [Anaerosporobacter faecicola]
MKWCKLHIIEENKVLGDPMGKSLKSNIARSLSGNVSLNRKSLQLKRSWDDVDKILQSISTKKKK